MKLSTNQLLLIGLGIVAVVVLALLMSSCDSSKNTFQIDPTAGMAYGGVQHVADYGSTQEAPSKNVYHRRDVDDPCTNFDDDCNADECATAGPSHPMYGVTHHVLGEKCWPGSNDPNDLTTHANHTDDFSVWDDGTKKPFLHNPVYGYGDCGDCKLRCHLDAQNPYRYDEGLECRCAANQKPRTSTHSTDPFTNTQRD